MTLVMPGDTGVPVRLGFYNPPQAGGPPPC